MSLIKSKLRIDEHGEVFTPEWMVEEMVRQIKAESDRIDSRVFEPACGTGNFIIPILMGKLKTVLKKFPNSQFDRNNYALLSVMSVYGIEKLRDNIEECRGRISQVLHEFTGVQRGAPLSRAIDTLTRINIVHGDTLSMRSVDGSPIVLAEWGYLGKGKFQRRDFRLDRLAKSGVRAAADSSSAGLGDAAAPWKVYLPMTVKDLAEIGSFSHPLESEAA